MSAPHLIAVSLFALGLVIRDGYEVLKKRGRVDTTDARVFAVVFTSMVVMWLSWFGIGIFATQRLPIPEPIRWVGLVAVVAGLVLAVGGMLRLGGVENIDHLVTTGLYSRIRHPMYAGFLLWVLGWCAYRGAPANLILAPLGIASIMWWLHLEETELESQYGTDYAEYRATTWF